MTHELSREDFRFMLKVLRYAGMGVLPAAEVAEKAISSIKTHVTLDKVHSQLEKILSGIMPSQEACLQGEEQLTQYYNKQLTENT